jgi:hypothetical protein
MRRTLLGLLFLELDDLVVDVHRTQRFQEQAGPAGRRAVHDARNRPRCSDLTTST